MGTRPITEEEQALLQKHGISPEPMRVHYRSACALHLVNSQTGAEITLHLDTIPGGAGND